MSVMAIDLDETDREILAVLATGRATPSYLSKQTDVTRQTIQNRLKPLLAADLVAKIDTGLYEITDEGREAREVPA